MIQTFDIFFKKTSYKIGLFIAIYLLVALTIAVARLPFLFSLQVLTIPVSILLCRKLLFFSFLGFLILFSTESRYLLSLFVLCLMITVQTLVEGQDLLFIAYGFRSLLAFLFVFCIPSKHGFRINSGVMDKVLKGLFFANLLLQGVHFFLGNGFYAKLFWLNLNSRNPGFFFFPAASAFFALTLFSLYASTKKVLRTRDMLIMIFSVGFCASITGIAGAALLVFLNRKKITVRSLAIAVFALVVGTGYLHLARLSMTGKTYLEETGGGRIKILQEVYSNASFFDVGRFGRYTNVAANFTNGEVADSQYSAIIGNLGYFWTLVVFAYLGWLLFQNFKRGENLDVVWLLLLCSVGLNVTETGPPVFLAILGRFIQFSNSNENLVEFHGFEAPNDSSS